jgi:CO dehydrogenase maturation factor
MRSVGVYRQYVGHARRHGVRVHVVGNKVTDAADEEFLREHVGADLLTCVSRSDWVRAAERGRPQPLAALGAADRAALGVLTAAADAAVKDWAAYTRQAVEFHLRNAQAWANAKVGEDLAHQVDPTFVLGPHLLADPTRGRVAVGAH